MKILAIEKEVETADWSITEHLLGEEARYVFEMYLSGKLREIYFNEHHEAVLLLETSDKQEALDLLDSLPLVKSGKIAFEITELRPYTGFQRILNT